MERNERVKRNISTSEIAEKYVGRSLCRRRGGKQHPTIASSQIIQTRHYLWIDFIGRRPPVLNLNKVRSTIPGLAARCTSAQVHGGAPIWSCGRSSGGGFRHVPSFALPSAFLSSLVSPRHSPRILGFLLPQDAYARPSNGAKNILTPV